MCLLFVVGHGVHIPVHCSVDCEEENVRKLVHNAASNVSAPRERERETGQSNVLVHNAPSNECLMRSASLNIITSSDTLHWGRLR